MLHNYRLLDASNVAATGELALIMNGAAAEYYLYDGATKMTSYDLDIEGEGEIVTVSKSSAGKISIATSKIGETVLKLSYDTFSHSFAVTVSARQYTMKNIADASVVTSESTISLWKGKSVSLRAYDGSIEIKTKKYTGSAEDEGAVVVDASGDCVKITGQAGGSVYVNAAYADEAGSIKVKVKVNVFGEPVITAHPDEEVKVSENGTATLAVIASGEELSYQWQKATSSGTFSNILGATENSYSFAVPMSVNGNRYRCVVSNPAGSTTSKEAVIKVVAGLPKITKQPDSELKVVGGSASSTVEVSVQATSSVTMNYQWVWSLDNTTWYVYSDKTAATITTTGNWITDALNNGYVLLRCKIT
ncbi:MAG: hypothetical protein HUJ92_08370, partial [Bacteroidales bacterium]|nr:hypothetical protein [Bacteroidales bacterium]